MVNVLLVASLIFIGSSVKAENNGTFPEGFIFGAASSAYQIEGGWQQDDKGENIWDRWIHTDPSRIKNNDTADVACNSYQYSTGDSGRAASLGVFHYKFSISWSRLLPTGTNSSISMKGIMYYLSCMEYMRYIYVTPVATLYHFDLPQSLQDLGGWTNPKMVDYFVQYARVAFQSFPMVQYWITFNDPRSICRLGYGTGAHAPGLTGDGVNEYLCAYTLIKAHAAVYHMYKEEFPELKAKISMAIDIEWSEPASDSEADIAAAERRNLFEFGLYAHPIFLGGWPSVVVERVGNRSKYEQLSKSRLIELTQEDINYINGTADFMAINTYTTRLVADDVESKYGTPGYMKDMKVKLSVDPSWDIAPNGNPIVPWGLRKALNWIKLTYKDPEIFITGNGVSDNGSSLRDTQRINYYRDYLSALLDAMYEDGVTVFGYTAWSLLDSFEWTEGYSQHYGFYWVNFTDPSKTRMKKESASFYSTLTATNRIPFDPVTDTTTKTTSSVTTSIPTTTEGDGASTIVVYPLLISIVTYICFLLA